MRRALISLALAVVCLAGHVPPSAAQPLQLPEATTVDMGEYFYPAGLDRVDDLIYVAARSAGLRIFRFAAPAGEGQPPRLTEIGYLDPDTTPSGQSRSNSVHVVGGLAYVADGVGGVRVIDVSAPRTPRLVATFATPGAALAVRAIGDRLYVACGPATWSDSTSFYGLIVASLPADPAQAPSELGRFAVQRPAELPYLPGGGGFPIHMDIQEQDGVLYVAFGFPGLYALDASNPADMRELGRLRPPALPGHPVFNTYASSIKFHNGRLLAGFMCLGLFDLTPARQADGTVTFAVNSITRVQTPAGYARRFDFHGDQVVLAERFDGLRVLDLTRTEGSAEPDVVAHPTLATAAVPDAFDVLVIGSYALVADFAQSVNDLGGYWPTGARGRLRMFDLSLVPSVVVPSAFPFSLMTPGPAAAIRKK